MAALAFSKTDDETLLELVSRYGERKWDKVASKIGKGYRAEDCKARWEVVKHSTVKVRFRAAVEAGDDPLCRRGRGRRKRMINCESWSPSMGQSGGA